MTAFLFLLGLATLAGLILASIPRDELDDE